MGYKVGITGSSYEDAQILRRADVGFSISTAGAAYTRQLSDIMLRDESFSSIVRVVLWGRSMYTSIKRTIQFELTANLVVVVTNIIGQITIQQECISDSQVLWMEMIVSSIGILAFVTEEPELEVVDKVPQYFQDYIVNAEMFRNIIAQTFVQVSLLMIFVFEGEYIFQEFEDNSEKVCHRYKNKNFVCSGRYNTADGDEDYLTTWEKLGPSRHFTYIFNIFILFQLFNMIKFRSSKHKVFLWVQDSKKAIKKSTQS